MRATAIPRIVPLALLLVLCMLQYQIWIGRGSMQQVAGMKQLLQQQQATNAQTEADMARIQSEIRDLKEGLATVEEKARFEMGMVKRNEIFVQIVHQSAPEPKAVSPK